MEYVSSLMIPFIIVIIVSYGLIKRVPVFDCFTDGVKQGLKATLSVTPSIMALVIAVSILKTSGFFELLGEVLKPFTDFLGIPKEIIPLCLMRPVSGSGANALLNDILVNHGPDSLCGKIASVLTGSTETTFYAVAVYYGAVGIKNTRYTVPCALTADITGMAMSCILIKLSGM